MSTMSRLMSAEFIKLRRSPALRLIWLLPVLFLALDFMFTGHFALGIKELSPEVKPLLLAAPIKSVGGLWAGLFHPLLIALLPALLFRPEHRFGLWKHLHTLPVSRRGLFLAKVFMLLIAFGVVLAMVEVSLWAEWTLMARIHPLIAFPFPWIPIAKVMAWSFLGSLPLLALYLWLADRINNPAVPIMFGLVGLILTIAMGGKESVPMWRRDLIPWVLPYTCAQLSIEDPNAKQAVHEAAAQYQEYEPKITPLPKVDKPRKIRVVLYNSLVPEPPTPTWVLATFSLSAWAVLLGLGVIESGRNRM